MVWTGAQSVVSSESLLSSLQVAMEWQVLPFTPFPRFPSFLPKASSGIPTCATALDLFGQKDRHCICIWHPGLSWVALWEKLCLSTVLAPCPHTGGQQFFLVTVQEWSKRGHHTSAFLGWAGEQAQGLEGLISALIPLLPNLMITEERKEVTAEACFIIFSVPLLHPNNR